MMSMGCGELNSNIISGMEEIYLLVDIMGNGIFEVGLE
jgi:hypothetical protein